jgi:hypothetical protein
MSKSPTSDDPHAVYMRGWRAKNIDKARAIERASQARQKAADPEGFRERANARYQKWLAKPGNREREAMRVRPGVRRSRRGLSPGERHDYWVYRDGRCDMCGADYPDPAVTGSWKFTVVDHDHAHCPYKIGCIGCVRGQGHRVCNVVEGHIKLALDMGLITAIDGPLVEYLADPPMQRWLRERAAKDDSLAA